jgi:hypothetical protein
VLLRPHGYKHFPQHLALKHPHPPPACFLPIMFRTLLKRKVKTHP